MPSVHVRIELRNSARWRSIAMKRLAVFSVAIVAVSLILAAGAAPTTAPSTAPSTPAELLASKGLTKSGNSYVLRAERELADGLRQIAQAQGKMLTETKNREKFEREIARAKQAFSQLEFKRRGYMSNSRKPRTAPSRISSSPRSTTSPAG